MKTHETAGAATRTRGWPVAVVVAAVAATLLLLAVLPGSAPARFLSEAPGIAQVLAFSRIFGIALVAVAAVAIGAHVLRRRVRRPRWFRVVTIGATAMLLVAGSVLVLWPSGSAQPAAPASSAGDRTLTIAVYNSQDTLAGSDLAELDRLGSPDVIVLPEGSASGARQAIVDSGLPLAVHTTLESDFGAAYSDAVAPTSVLTRTDRGEYEQADAPPTSFGSVAVRDAGRSGVSVLGIHAAPPLPALMDAWRADLRIIAQAAAAASGPTVIAGDFNATLRHGPMTSLDGYVDAALTCAEPGTWPVSLPAAFATPIDHILVRADAEIRSCLSAQIGRGDHRAVIVTIAL